MLVRPTLGSKQALDHESLARIFARRRTAHLLYQPIGEVDLDLQFTLQVLLTALTLQVYLGEAHRPQRRRSQSVIRSSVVGPGLSALAFCFSLCNLICRPFNTRFGLFNLRAGLTLASWPTSSVASQTNSTSPWCLWPPK